MKKENDRKLKKLLRETSEIQIAVITTKVFYIEEHLEEVTKKLDSLVAWKIKVTAMAAGMGILGGLIVTLIKLLI